VGGGGVVFIVNLIPFKISFEMIIISELGFVPVIDGVKHAPQDSELSNLVVRAPVARPRTDLPASRFNNFRPNEIRTDDTDVKESKFKRKIFEL